MLVESGPEIPNYDLIQHIGSGGFGDVWLATERLTGQHRAVKLLDKSHPRRSDKEIEGVRQYQGCANNHAHLLQILTVGEVESHYYYVMEMADNLEADDPESYSPKTLRYVIDRAGNMDVREALELCSKILAALNRLHEQGLGHFDLKPDNIMFVRGEPKIADLSLFGTKGQKDVRGGTSGYRSPTGQADDLYALGKILYELITGCPAVDYPRLPAGIVSQRSSVTGAAIRLVNQLCHTDPRHRLTDGREFKAAIDGILQPPRRGFRSGALVVLVVTIVFLAAGLLYWQQRPERIQAVTLDKQTTDDSHLKLTYETHVGGKDLRGFGIRQISMVELCSGERADDDRILVGTSVPCGDDDDVIWAFDSAFNILWKSGEEFQPADALSKANWPDCPDHGHWYPTRTLEADVNSDGTMEFVVVHKMRGACYQWGICVVNEMTGQVEARYGSFYHFGQIDGIAVLKDFFPTDGGRASRPAILAWGVNNKLDGFGQGGGDNDIPSADYPFRFTSYDKVAFVMILDPMDMNGLGPPGVEPLIDTAWLQHQTQAQREAIEHLQQALPTAHVYAYAFIDAPFGPHPYRPCNGGEIMPGDSIERVDTAIITIAGDATSTYQKLSAASPVITIDLSEAPSGPGFASPDSGPSREGILILDRHLNLKDRQVTPESQAWITHMQGQYRVLIQDGKVTPDLCNE